MVHKSTFPGLLRAKTPAPPLTPIGVGRGPADLLQFRSERKLGRVFFDGSRAVMTSARCRVRQFVWLLLAVGLIPATVAGQPGDSRLRVFGYLQGSFYYQANVKNSESATTFTTQQLNILMQKNLARRWRGFVNLAFTNTYSSYRNWGTFSIEEAWVGYRKHRYLNLKMGLLIPRFNYLNEYRNRMPVLPYIIRPLAYETSFQEDVPIEDLVPQRAFVQLYGSTRRSEFEFDYAAYAGNSPDVNSDPNQGNTGVDFKTSALFGGRIGFEYSLLKAGFSATHDEIDELSGLSPDSLTQSAASQFEDTPRVRLGGDLRIEYRDISFWAEVISVQYDDGIPDVNVDQAFWYATLGNKFFDRLFIFGTYWDTGINQAQWTEDKGWESANVKIKIPGVGVAYYMHDQTITLKAGVAWVRIDIDYPIPYPERKFNHYSLAISVMF